MTVLETTVRIILRRRQVVVTNCAHQRLVLRIFAIRELRGATFQICLLACYLSISNEYYTIAVMDFCDDIYIWAVSVPYI